MRRTKEEKSFFLYETGRELDVLCLGNLVLGDYTNPTTARHYTHRPLTDIETENYVSASELSECTIRNGSSWGPGLSVTASGFSQASLKFDDSSTTIVAAKKGRRVVLKNPGTFLNFHILRTPEAQNELRKWVSAARSDLILKLKSLRTPKIWMLTGVYILDDAAVLSISKRDLHTSIGIGSNTLFDLMTVPVGGSIGLGSSSYLESRMSFTGSHVWAAQYRLLDIRYIKIEPGQDSVDLPSQILLYPKITSHGVLRGSPSASQADQAHVCIAAEDSSDTEMQKLDRSEDEEYNSLLDEEIQFMEDILGDEV
ncbi:hypothetical protein BGW36DRAFT_412936 [Talaromyces proteolyticus]|uniref:Uncharacterized protein n=1 Tax=Talaromyces proteolyticus TaxID=1131652 RepID=A0AAD4L2K6_9EURO|nr:uncharacterized protein BGW36DRAFT_412936 [Talaromyces proteolyticus]KAH8704767.1 hypothetical protein BGW36DRAFT_412936 [Talaromyces proteolyticus]